MNPSRTLLDKFCFSAGSSHAVQSWSKKVLVPLGFTSYEFGRFYDDGTAFTLYSNSAMAKYVVEKALQLVAHVPSSVLLSRFWYLPTQNDFYCQTLREIKSMANGEGFGNFIIRFSGYFEMHSFLSPLPQGNVGTQFLNCKDKLETICLSFPEIFRELIKDADRDRFVVPLEMAPNFKGLGQVEGPTCPTPLGLQFKKIKAELETLVRLKRLPLTRRELDCIEGLFQGKTSQEIATEFSLSKRTVEHYLDVIKDKLNCTRKTQIISLFTQN